MDEAPVMISEEQIMDLRRRVLSGENVSNEELQAAVSSLTLKRSSSGQPKATAIVPKIDLAAAFAKFKLKTSGGSVPPSGAPDGV